MPGISAMTQPTAAARQSLIEVEQKFHLADCELLQSKLLAAGATEIAIEQHADTYYRHPGRDFAQTREALRIRRIARPMNQTHSLASDSSQSRETLVTYKGPYSTTGVKARPELEWQIDPCDEDGQKMASLFEYLGFTPVMTVRKIRRSFMLNHADRQLVVTIDDAQQLGMFAEIETIAAGEQEIEACRERVSELAEMLDLRQPEKKSYLTMAMEALATQQPPK